MFVSKVNPCLCACICEALCVLLHCHHIDCVNTASYSKLVKQIVVKAVKVLWDDFLQVLEMFEFQLFDLQEV